MPTFESKGIRYYYAERKPQNPTGECKTLILVHGAGGSSSHYKCQLDGLGGQHRVIAPDLPGHGRSAGEAQHTITAYREFIRELADSLSLQGFYLCGHSMGGAIALDFALQDPGRLAGLILVGTGARLRILPAILETFRNSGHFEGLTALAYGKEVPQALLEAGAREMASVSPLVWFRDFTACNNFDVIARLAEIRIPTLVITGTLDLLTPVKYARFLEANIPGAKMELVSGAGHMVMLEKPEIMNELIMDFIEG